MARYLILNKINGIFAIMYIPKYFTLKELIKSITATKYGLDNTPTFEVVVNLSRLCELILDDARIKLGEPIIVSSGYRSIELNRKVGGVISSQHLKGLAVDISCSDNNKLFKILSANKNVDQLLYEYSGLTRWIHISIASVGCKPRGYINNNYNANK